MMTIFLRLFLCFFVIGVSCGKSEEEFKKLFMQKGVECSDDHALTSEEMQQLQKHKLPDTVAAKCFMACVFKKVNWMNSSGMFDVDAANAMVEKEHVDDSEKIEISKKLFQMCKKVNEETVSDNAKGCERSEHLFKCLTENAPQIGFKMP